MAHGKHVRWALLDQSLVSGVNFLTGILLARFLGLEGYGQFVLLYAVLLYASAIQLALIISPMMSIFPKIEDAEERKRYVSGILALQLLLAVVSVFLLAAVGYVLSYFWPEWQLETYFLPLGATIIFFQLQDWLRRYYFSSFRPALVFATDLISYGGQLFVMIALYAAGELTVSTALWAIAATSAVAFCFGWAKETILFRFRDALVVYRQNFSMARNLLVSGQIQWSGTQGVLLASAGFLGVEASGGIRAAQNILGPFNILNNVVMNIVPVQAALYFRDSGLARLIQYLRKVAVIIGIVVLGVGIIVSIFSSAIMSQLYGESYVVYAHLIIWGVGFWLLSIIAGQFSIYHRTVETSHHLITASLLLSVVSVTSVLATINALKETSIFLAAILGQLIAIIYLWYTASRKAVKS